MSLNRADGRPEVDSTSDHIRATFALTPHPDAGCAVLETGERSSQVTQTVVTDGSNADCECRAEVEVDDSSDRRFLSTSVRERCICPVLRDHDCLSTIEGFEDGKLTVSVVTTDRDVIVDVVSALRDVGATVHLRRLTRSTVDSDDQLLEFEANAITEKQREAVRTAVREGYYETPRRCDLEELAEHLGVSKSAVSQRLNAVETKLVSELVEVDGGSRPVQRSPS